MEYLSLREAAELLRLSTSRLSQLVSEGKIQSLQLQPHGRLLFRKSDLESALQPRGTFMQRLASEGK